MNHTNTDLDEECLVALYDLAEIKPRLYFPFFANTFPLAFHYRGALQRKGVSPREEIKLIEWGEEPQPNVTDSTSADADSPMIYYGTSGSAAATGSTNSVPIGQYNPKSIFVEYSLRARKEVTPHSSYDTRMLKELVGRLMVRPRPEGRPKIQVRTELPRQAGALMGALGFSEGEFSILCRNIPFAEESDSVLYLYGAPLTAYLRRKSDRFIEIPLSQEVVATQREYDTYVYVRGGKDASLVQKALAKYWEVLRRAVDRGNRDHFWSVCMAYNGLARALQHRSSFPDAESYLECLKSHKVNGN